MKRFTRDCIETATSRPLALDASYFCVEFLGSWSGALGDAPAHLLAWVLGPMPEDLLTVEVQP